MLSTRSKRWLAASAVPIVALAAASVAGGHPEDPDPGCNAHHGCGWKYPGYEHKGDSDGWNYVHNEFDQVWIGPGRISRSAKNRFENRALKYTTNPNNPDAPFRCLDPGENRVDMQYAMDWVRVSEPGGHC